jgi:hypothetical protein
MSPEINPFFGKNILKQVIIVGGNNDRIKDAVLLFT